MKNIILLIAIIFSYPALAISEGNNLYIKGSVSLNKTIDVKDIEPDINYSLSHKSKFTPSFGIGIGQYISDKVRTDLMFEYLTFNFNKTSGNFDYVEGNTLTTGAKTIKRQAHGKALMLNFYLDIINKEFFDIFVGAGGGVSRIKEKVEHFISGNSFSRGKIYSFPLITENFNSKTTHNFAYALIIGTNMRINPQMHCELSYSWKNYGRVKHYAIAGGRNPKNNWYKGHSLSAGLRFDL